MIPKFRGFRTKTEEWVEGNLIYREEPYQHDIVTPIGNCSTISYAVERDSIGQWTGLKDKNGVEIFEGDIIELVFVNDELIVAVMNKRIKEEDVNKDDLEEVERYEVYYNSKHGCYCIANIDPEIRKRETVNWLDDSDMLSEWNKEAKVIGNTYEI